MGRELAIFPLPLVLFPGAAQPLHIFESRYRQMLADCLAADRRFGVTCVMSERGADPALALGTVGCIAFIRATHQLPDGRSNLATVGERRFVILEWLAVEPYRRARVEEFDDEPVNETEIAPIVKDVRQDFSRLVGALATLTDRESDRVDLSNDPALLSFQVAAALELEPTLKQKLLALRDTAQRLRQLAFVLGPLAADAEKRAAVHRRARGNGKGGERPHIERTT